MLYRSVPINKKTAGTVINFPCHMVKLKLNLFSSVRLPAVYICLFMVTSSFRYHTGFFFFDNIPCPAIFQTKLYKALLSFL